ncbi:MAG: toxin-activating lysine-acyltransferase [Alphaproteobacteria bacterium]|nr:toxin-activating lysine-acyltransferase [Alphaproteobacteria bacterium]
MVKKASKPAVLENVADREQAKDGEHMSDMSTAGSGRARDATPKALDPAVVAQMAEFREKLQASVGEVVLALASLPRYRSQTLADVLHLIIAPMLRNRVAIAKSAVNEGSPEETAGFAIWASVLDEAEARIREQIKARVFAIRLKAEDWNSGEHHWLLDVIAPSQKMATGVLANFKRVAKDKLVHVHPIASQLVDPALLEKLRVRPAEEPSEQLA